MHFAYSGLPAAGLDSAVMNKTLLVVFLSLPATLASGFVPFFVYDIARLVFGSATPAEQRLVMLALPCIQLAFVFALAHCICRRHCAELRGEVR